MKGIIDSYMLFKSYLNIWFVNEIQNFLVFINYQNKKCL